MLASIDVLTAHLDVSDRLRLNWQVCERDYVLLFMPLGRILLPYVA